METFSMIGQKFGRLTVIKEAGRKRNKITWLCVCDCGNECEVVGTDLRTGNTKSCGCLNRERAVENIKGQRRKAVPMIGKRFGRLVVQSLSDESEHRKLKYLCKCDCGKEVVVFGSCLRSGKTKSCGCLAKEVQRRIGTSSKGHPSKRIPDLVGKIFGRLKVIESLGSTAKGQKQWRCLCSCGKEVITTTGHLNSGHTKSCGCLGLENATKAKIKHGQSNTSLYNVFLGIHSRCENPNEPGYKWYGAKGIKVCEEWKNFNAFADWAKNHGYQQGLTIDRINPQEGYSPDNCEWITRAENIRRMHKAHGHKIKE